MTEADTYREGRDVVVTRPVDMMTWEFDPTQYRIRYADLADLTDRRLAGHFETRGRAEGRIGRLSGVEIAALQPSRFEVSEYRTRYADMSELSDAEAVAHFLRLGRAEGRVGRLTEGEKEALEPTSFIAAQYRSKYADIGDVTDAEALQHYLEYGVPEGRSGVWSATGLDLPVGTQRPGRETVLVVVHEASRTGVPILAWNLVRETCVDRNVVVVFLSKGELLEAFEALDADIVVLADGMPDDKGEMVAIVDRLADVYAPDLAIVTSVVSYSAAVPLAAKGIPVVLTTHEAAPPPHSPQSVIDAVETAVRTATTTVYSAEKVRESFETAYGNDVFANAVLVRQGAYERPAIVDVDGGEAAVEAADLTGPVVLGVGSVNPRKGVEFFVQAAAYAQQLGLADDVRFVWLGASDPGTSADFRIGLDDQVKYSGLEDRVLFAGEVADVDSFYQRASVVFLPSRFDPLPNSALDALALGIPVVSFDHAGGIAEIMGNGETASLVVPYLDSAAAARRIVALLSESDERATLGKASRAVLDENCLPMAEYASTLLTLGAKR